MVGSSAGGHQDARGSVHTLIKTEVDPRQDPASAKFSSCKLYKAQPETIVARGTFAVPFPYSGGTISVFLFNPTHPGGAGSPKSLPVTHKGARTWQFTFNLYGTWKPTIGELAIAAPDRKWEAT
jgi:hypothetical protein